MEQLIRKITSADSIRGINSGVSGHKAEAFADDLTVLYSARLEVVQKSVSCTLEILKTFVITAIERLKEDVENATTRSDAGLILKAMLSFSFLTFLGLWRDILREINDTQKFLKTKGLDLQQCAFKLSVLKAYLLQNRDKISVDAAQSYAAELRREMLSVIDRLVGEISSRFENLQNIAKKYIFLTPSKVLDKQNDCNLDVLDKNIQREEFLIESTRLSNYFAAADAEEMEGPLQLLQFIQKYNLTDSVPNIVIL
ncbi:unnamed protein product [Lepeophtheirus salmonis]|uniref:(salmon louse) hypothetical protein n=1 Tax=Lepeophtheirus salmonis TaxID=72036 RepID=A0A7R8CZ79_LEPSM|nr:unnamed protein product [Lepeophtheirus salmonis]CAF2947812.1 unnamed protein product [Lepeophtheirus salmonis]